MPIPNPIFEEMKVLALFNLDSSQEGIKVHTNAAAESIAATERLFTKGLITQADGGYLTHQGIEAAQHAQALLTILQD